MGDTQFYLHGSAFSTTLSTLCRQKLQFYLHGNAFSNFRMHLSSTRLKQMSFRKSSTNIQVYLNVLHIVNKMCNFTLVFAHVLTCVCKISPKIQIHLSLYTSLTKCAMFIGFCICSGMVFLRKQFFLGFTHYQQNA